MTWLNPPKDYRRPEHELPFHGGELGLVWIDDEGRIWETVQTGAGFYFSAVEWCQAHPERAEILWDKYFTVDELQGAELTPLEKALVKRLYGVLVEISLEIDGERTRGLHPELIAEVRHLTRHVEEAKLNE